MELMLAFQAMLNDVHTRNASRRQIGNMLTWCEYTRLARDCVVEPTRGDGLEVRFAQAATHRTWRASSFLILHALKAQEQEALHRRVHANFEAEREDRKARAAAEEAAAARSAAAAARSRAAEARNQAAAARSAAASADDENKGYFIAQAEAAEANAAAADSEAGAADSLADERETAAQKHRDSATEFRALARRLLQWEIAARDASGIGSKVVAVEEPVAVGVGEGITAAGGIREVPDDKRWLTRGRVLVPATIGGRAR